MIGMLIKILEYHPRNMKVTSIISKKNDFMLQSKNQHLPIKEIDKWGKITFFRKTGKLVKWEN